MSIRRRQVLKAAVAGTVALTAPSSRAAPSAAKPLRIGYTLSQSGPYAPGAASTQAPNYAMWAARLKEQGGLEVAGEGKRPVEFVALDDKSSPELAVKLYEDLCGQQKVDLILPPWGTHLNFEVMPVAEKHGYPLLASTATSSLLAAKGYKYLYTLLSEPSSLMGALAEMLAEAHANKAISRIGVAYNSDLAGMDLHKNFAQHAGRLKLPVVHSARYPLTARQFEPIINELKAKQVDAFIGITYPEDNFVFTKQAQAAGWNPKVFYTAIGTAFPKYRDVFGRAEGVCGIGGWNPRVKFAGAREYYDLHVKSRGVEPDRWASAFCWASLQILEASVRAVGLDRQKLKAHLDKTEFQTVAGPIKFTRGLNRSTPGMVGQWQKGEFEIVWPKKWATSQLILPKPPWAAG